MGIDPGLADVRDLSGQLAPLLVGGADQPVHRVEEPELVGDARVDAVVGEQLAADPSHPRERRDRQDAVRLATDADGRDRTPADDVPVEPGAGADDRVVVEHRLHHLVEQVAERRRPQRLVHGARLGLVGAVVIGRRLEQVGVDPEMLGQPATVLAVAPLVRVVGRVLAEEVLVAEVGVVAPRVARHVVLDVVGRCSLGEHAEALAAALVVGDQAFEVGRSCLWIGRDPHAEHEQPVEAAPCLDRVEVDAEAHAVVDGNVEVGHPLHRIGHHELAVLDSQLLLLRRRRVGTDRQLGRDRAPDVEQGLLVAVEAEHHQTLREHGGVGGVHPWQLLAVDRRLVGQLEELDPDRGRRIGRHGRCGEVLRGVAGGDQLGAAAPTALTRSAKAASIADWSPAAANTAIQ